MHLALFPRLFLVLRLRPLFSMENFITGYPATEAAIRDALTETIGAEKAEFFFDKVRITRRPLLLACLTLIVLLSSSNTFSKTRTRRSSGGGRAGRSSRLRKS